jgi:hypothetical protein
MRTYAHFLPGGNRESAEVLAGLLSGNVAKKPAIMGSWKLTVVPARRSA